MAREAEEILEDIDSSISQIANAIEALAEFSDPEREESKPSYLDGVGFAPSGWKWAEPTISERDNGKEFVIAIYNDEDKTKSSSETVFIRDSDSVEDINSQFASALNALIRTAESWGKDYRQEAIDAWMSHMEFENFIVH